VYDQPGVVLLALKTFVSLIKLNPFGDMIRLRPSQSIRSDKQLRTRWEKDEENWRKLPGRAWPERQPEVEEETELRKAVNIVCKDQTSSTCLSVKFQVGWMAGRGRAEGGRRGGGGLERMCN